MKTVDELVSKLIDATPDELLCELEESIYCTVCRHFGCDVAELGYGEHKAPEPCGRFDCCIN